MWRSEHRPLGRRQRRIRALSRKGWRVWGLIAGLLLAVWGVAAGVAFWIQRRETASDHLPEIALEAKQDFIYALAKLEPGQSRFFTYPISSSERSKLILNRDSDGVVRTAFASCTTCYSFRRQHYLKEGKLICGQCRDPMRIGDQNERITPDKGCVAVPIPFSVENDKVIVRSQAFREGMKVFTSAAESSNKDDGSRALADRR